MKRLIAFASICALLPLASCGVGDGTFVSCQGPYSGTFQVDLMGVGLVEGRLLGYLGPLGNDDPDDQLLMELMPDTDDDIINDFECRVTSDGAVTIVSAGAVLTGNFDFDKCEGSGTWESPEGQEFYANGTWRLSIDSTAY